MNEANGTDRGAIVSAFLHGMALPLGIGALLWFNAQIQPWIYDDALITMRFAENLASGHGPVFNPGEDPVEGYTCFLWMCLLAVGHLLGVDLPAWGKGLGTAFGIGTLLLAWQAHRIVPGLRRDAATLATLALGTAWFFATWAMSGMEVTTAAFFLLLAVLLHARSRQDPARVRLVFATAVACVLAAMCRPDAGLLAAVLGLDRLLFEARRAPRNVFLFGATFALLFGAYFAWRWSYYGWPLPNTFYNKVGGTREQMAKGVDYVTRFGLAATLTALPALLFALLPGRAPLPRLLAGYLALHTAYVTSVGGDYMPAYRFFATVFPVACLLAGAALARPRWHPAWILVPVLLIGAQNAYHWQYGPDTGLRLKKDGVARRGQQVGEWLREHAPPGAIIATNTAGSIPFYSKLPTIDMLGLCDETIAHTEVHLGTGQTGHEKANGKYVLSRAPDYIQFGSSRGSEKAGFRSDKQIAREREFRRDYDFHLYDIPGMGRLSLYVRKPEADGKGLAANPVNAPKPARR